MLDTKYVRAFTALSPNPTFAELTDLKASDNQGRNAEEPKSVAKPYACVLDLLSQAAPTNMTTNNVHGKEILSSTLIKLTTTCHPS